ncbi:hypothetical protein niasHT_010514 [Heterodera trifolii]|uniref:B30.2/SPRY domain-containing protein n=1 Tax=Heterodera trifolii TaxID=157864 RepID=A0ABD2L201_9BILA
MAKRKASSMLLSSSSESAGVAEQNENGDNDGGQNEVIYVPASAADGQHHKQQQNKLVEKCAKMEAEMNMTKLELENRTLKAELKQRELMDELKALQAKVAKMEEQKPNYVSLEQFESILGRIGELENHKKHQREKQQQKGEDDEEEEEGTATSTSQRRLSRRRTSTTQQTEFSAKISEFEKKQTAKFKAHLTKIEKQYSDLVTSIQAKVAAMEERQKNTGTFNAALREQMGNELLKAVHPNFRVNIAEKLIYSQQKNCWDLRFCHKDLKIIDAENLMVQHKGTEKAYISVFAQNSIPPNVASGIFYFEIKIVNVERHVTLGLVVKTTAMHGTPELRSRSCAYRSDGIFFIENFSWANESARCSRGDVAGFGLNLATRQIIFTKNGIRIVLSQLGWAPNQCHCGECQNFGHGVALTEAMAFFSSKKFPGPMEKRDVLVIIFTKNGIRIDTSDLFFYPSHLYDYYRSLYPCVSLTDPGDLIEANFGPIFKFDPTKKQLYQNFTKNCWDADACHSDLEITGTECLTVHYKGVGNGLRTIFAKCAAPLNVAGIFYYEITVINEQLIVSFGFATKAQQIPMPLDGTIKRCRGTCAYENNAFYWVDGRGRKSRHRFSGGDTVGCGINLATRHVFFTKNGKRLDFTIMLPSLTINQQQQQLFPFVILGDSDDKIEANFGPNFKFDFKSFY